MDDDAYAKMILMAPHQRSGRDNQGVLVSRGWIPSSAIWEPTTSHWTRQLTWPRTALCGGWCLHIALHTPSGACQEKRRRHWVQCAHVDICMSMLICNSVQHSAVSPITPELWSVAWKTQHKSRHALLVHLVEERLEFGLCGQLPLSGWPHNPTTRFWPPSTTVVSPESLQHCAGSLRCLPKEMVTSRLWPVYLWRTTNNVSHLRFLSAYKVGWWLVQSALCRWWCCCMADQLWRLIEDAHNDSNNLCIWSVADMRWCAASVTVIIAFNEYDHNGHAGVCADIHM